MAGTRQFSSPIQQPLDDASDLCQLLKVLANPNRLRILLYLLRSEVSVGEIASSLKIKQPSLSHELKKLRDAELVATKRQSKAVIYRLKNDAIKTLLISVRRALQESKQVYHQQSQPVIGGSQDSKAFECGLFANIQQHTVD
jgi:DNA-binding transcriptional ArsR family regulator